MNRNSLEDFREQAAALKMPAGMQEAIEKQMEKNLETIAVTAHLPSHKGHLEVTAHLKRGAGDSEYYFFNKYDLAYNNKVKPLGNDYQYAVRTDVKDGVVLEKPLLRRFDSPIAAIDFFNKQKGNSELFTGKVSANGKLTEGQSLATMNDGKVDYVTRDFQGPYRNTVVKNTVYVNKGVGFNMTQSSNMLQGGSAHRDDLVSRAGEQYQAWNVYKFDEPRDKYGNLVIKQYGEGYPFNLEKELSNYRIKELESPEKFNAIVAAMKDGERPVVTALTETGELKKLQMEAVPRFGNLNFFSLDNRPVNREQFQKVVKQGKDISAGKEKGASQSQEMSM
ncbi:hypothetical protein ABDJ41_20765 [Pedobacter sp. ASV1-7]|uniref:hypothetical protein n=1 Tax=Pedobacter sp. ASV1-7 TaxID=3145237 RepID=UPI0032E91B50